MKPDDSNSVVDQAVMSVKCMSVYKHLQESAKSLWSGEDFDEKVRNKDTSTV